MPGTVIMNGIGGRPYAFPLHPLHGTVFDRDPGVYVVIRSGVFGLLQPLYVGETDDFYQRLITNRMSHEGLGRAIMRGATHIAALRVADRPTRLAIETDLRHSLKPPCNEQGLGLFG